MKATLRLGRFAGVDVGVHWSVLGILALLIIGLSTELLPMASPGHSAAIYAGTAVIVATLFLASLLAHELAHAVIALREGMRVHGITLWLLGGVARLGGEAKNPAADARVAGVGPLTSLVLGGIFAGLTAVLRRVGADPLVTGSCAYLALINIILGVFNLIPAAPLDGGRLLRAGLWARFGDRHRAGVWSARAGRGLGFLLIALGFVELFTRSLGGLWWVLLGMFMVTIASAEEQQEQMMSALGGLRVRDVMTRDPVTASADLSVDRFLRDVTSVRPHSAYPLPDGALVTLHRLRDVPVQSRSTTTLRQIACPASEVPTAEPDEPLPSLLSRVRGVSEGRALVFANGALVGIVSPSDISRAATWHGLMVRPPRGGPDISAPGNLRIPGPTHWKGPP